MAAVETGILSERLGKAVRRRRLRRGLSQEELAHLAGLHRTYISLLERGLRNPSLAVIWQIAEALDTSMASIVGEVESPRRRRG